MLPARPRLRAGLSRRGGPSPRGRITLPLRTAPNLHRPPLHSLHKNVVPKRSSFRKDDASSEKKKTFFAIMYAKNTRKKQKSWQDGYLVVTNDRHVALHDEDGKRMMAEGMPKLNGLVEGNTLVLKSLLIEVQHSVIEENFLSGRLFMKNAVPLPVSQTSHPRPQQRPFKPLRPKGVPKRSSTPQPLHNPDTPDAIIIDNDGIPVVLDPSIARKIRPHQIAGVKFLFRCVKDDRGAILADDMGLGKSLQAISLIWTMLKQGRANGGLTQKAVIVCPASLVANWVNEVKKWLGDDRLKPVALEGGSSTFGAKQSLAAFINGNVRRLLIVSYEMFRTNGEELYKAGIGLLVCDEGHRLKSSQGNKTIEALKKLPCRRRVILTGTPVQNDLEEFFAVCDFVNPGCFNSLSSFRSVFAGPIIASRDSNASASTLRLGKARAKELSNITSQFVLRRSSSILERYLPPKQETAIFCRLQPQQEADYAQESKARYNNIAGERFSAALCAINYLRKICSHPALVQKNDGDGDGGDEYGTGGRVECKEQWSKEKMLKEFKVEDSSKMQVALSICEESLRMNDKVILVSNFTSTLDLIQEALKRAKISYCRLDGGTAVKHRGDIVRKFNEGIIGDIFLLSAKAGGVGLNLIGANRLILFDPDWNPATDLQAMARVWRDGQKKHVFVYRLLCTGTIEEKIFQRQLFKGELQSAVQDGPKMEMEGMMGGGKEGNFSRDQLRDLFKYSGDLKYCETLEVLRRSQVDEMDDWNEYIGEEVEGKKGSGWLLQRFSEYEGKCEKRKEGDESVLCEEDYALGHALNASYKTDGLVSYLYTKKSGNSDAQKGNEADEAVKTRKRKLPAFFEGEEEESDAESESDEELSRAVEAKKARIAEAKGGGNAAQSGFLQKCMDGGGKSDEGQRQEAALEGADEAWDEAIDALDFDGDE